MLNEKPHSIKDLDEDEGLFFSHPQKCIVSVSKHATKPSDVIFRICIELGEFFEHSDVRGGTLQKLKNHLYRNPFLRLVSQRRSYDFPKFVRKSKFLALLRSLWSLALDNLFHDHCASVVLWERQSPREHLGKYNREVQSRETVLPVEHSSPRK